MRIVHWLGNQLSLPPLVLASQPSPLGPNLISFVPQSYSSSPYTGPSPSKTLSPPLFASQPFPLSPISLPPVLPPLYLPPNLSILGLQLYTFPSTLFPLPVLSPQPSRYFSLSPISPPCTCPPTLSILAPQPYSPSPCTCLPPPPCSVLILQLTLSLPGLYTSLTQSTLSMDALQGYIYHDYMYHNWQGVM